MWSHRFLFTCGGVSKDNLMESIDNFLYSDISTQVFQKYNLFKCESKFNC